MSIDDTWGAVLSGAWMDDIRVGNAVLPTPVPAPAWAPLAALAWGPMAALGRRPRTGARNGRA